MLIVGHQLFVLQKCFLQTIMERSRLRSKSRSNRIEESKVLYAKQRNYFLYLFKKSKNEYFAKLSEIKCPVLADKVIIRDHTVNRQVLHYQKEIRTTEFRDYLFSNIGDNFQIS